MLHPNFHILLFFAWLIRQIGPDSDYNSSEVQNKGLELLNECLKIHEFEPISGLKDIDSVDVTRELSHIDIVAFIKTKGGRNIGLIIENKVGAQESRKNQLIDYCAEGKKIIDENFKNQKSDKVFIYLKSDYDYDDPLTRFDENRNIVKTNFKIINFKKLFEIFDASKNFEDSILKSYAWWMENKYKYIKHKLTVDIGELLSINKGPKLLENDHIGQTRLIKNIFVKSFNNKQPECAEKDVNGYHRYYYTSKLDSGMFIKLGTNSGSPWTELWFSEKPVLSDISFFYRLQFNRLEPLFHARLGYWDKNNRSSEKQNLHDKYLTLIDKHGMKNLKTDFKFNPNNQVSSMSTFRILGEPIEILQKIEELHFDFLSEIEKEKLVK